MSRLILLVVGSFSVWLIVGFSCAFADTAPASVATVSAAPWVAIVSAVLTPIVLMLASAVGAWAVRVFSRWTHMKVTAQNQAIFQTAAANGAGRILAAAEGDISKMSIPVGSAAVANEANNVAALIPGTLAALGVHPADVGDVLANAIAGKIGLLQAGAQASQPSIPVPLPVTPAASTGG